VADGRVLLPGGRDAAAARPPGDGGAEQAPVRLRARALVRLGRRAAALRRKKMWAGQGGGRRRGAARAVRGVGAVPAERRQPARVHRRDAVRDPRRAHAALLGGKPVHLLQRRPHPVSPRYAASMESIQSINQALETLHLASYFLTRRALWCSCFRLCVLGGDGSARGFQRRWGAVPRA
jgi:hypothetical protein